MIMRLKNILFNCRNITLFVITGFAPGSCMHVNSAEDGSYTEPGSQEEVKPFTSGNRKNLLLESTFEGKTYLAGWYNQQHCCNYSVSQITTARTGSGAIKFDLKKTDEKVSGSVRSEISRDPEPLNCERWYGVSFYLDNYGFDGGAETILQWHHTAHISSGSPPLGLQVTNGKLVVVTSMNDNNNYDGDLGEATQHKWIDIVMHIKWTDSATGFIEVWRDGVKKLSRKDVVTNASESYVKLGINKWSWMPGETSTQKHRVLYADEFRIGNEMADYDDVKPGN
jgi:hypothetical protein